MIQITKNGNKVILSISVELDKEDLIELGGDLSKHAHSILNDKTFSSLAKDAKPMLQNREIDTTGWSKEKLEAYQQAQSKLELENKMNDASLEKMINYNDIYADNKLSILDAYNHVKPMIYKENK